MRASRYRDEWRLLRLKASLSSGVCSNAGLRQDACQEPLQFCRDVASIHQLYAHRENDGYCSKFQKPRAAAKAALGVVSILRADCHFHGRFADFSVHDPCTRRLCAPLLVLCLSALVLSAIRAFGGCGAGNAALRRAGANRLVGPGFHFRTIPSLLCLVGAVVSGASHVRD